MPTPFDHINSIFYDLVERDSEFFDYYGLSHVESMNLAERRADSCLLNAVAKLSSENETDIDFMDYDAEARTFNVDLTQKECFILARLQYQQYLYRDFITLRAQATRFTSAEQAVFSPANERKTFLQMYDSICAENSNLLNSYLSRDRITGQRKSLTYTDV